MSNEKETEDARYSVELDTEEIPADGYSSYPAPSVHDSVPTELSSASSNAVDADALADMRSFSNLQEKRRKKKRKKAIVIAASCLTVLVLLIGGIWWFANSMTEDPVMENPIETTFVEKGVFLNEVTASGKLTPIFSVSATPEVDGLVGEVLVVEGDIVTEGQTLYTVVNDDLDKAIVQAQNEINEAYSGIETAQIAVNDAYHAKKVGQRAASAAPTTITDEKGEVVTIEPEPFDVEAANSVIRQAELALSSANTALETAQVAYNDAVALAEKRTVISPIDGSVVSVNIESGKSIGGANGSAASPVQIANLSQMLVSVEVNEIDILKIATEQSATLTFSAIPDLTLEGVVNRIATINSGGEEWMDMGAVTYTVDILIENPDPRLKPGMTAKASVETQKIEDVLLVPLSAVMSLSETEGSIFVANPDDPQNPQERTIEILASDGLMMAVKGDLSEGDEIMLVGGTNMFDPSMYEGEMQAMGMASSDTAVG